MEDLWTTFVSEFKQQTPTSSKLFDRAANSLPGGNTRATVFFKPYPIYARKAKGAIITDVDGNERIDLACNFGPLILGHNHPRVVAAVRDQLENGEAFGSPTETEVKLAEMICLSAKCVERVLFCASGSEATLKAVRAARAFTGKKKIAKFEGVYNGSHDFVEVSVKPPASNLGSPESPNRVPDSAGITQGVLDDILVLPWNDPENAAQLILENKSELAAVIANPIGRVNPPRNGFLEYLREVTQEAGVLLIFDEVITGFRLARGGAQEYYGVVPDIACYGKIIGGGYPCGALGASKEIMSLFNPGDSGQSAIPNPGTYNGHPVSLAAGLATLQELTGEVYERLNSSGEYLRKKVQSVMDDFGIEGIISGVGSYNVPAYFGIKDDRSYRETCKSDKRLEALYSLGCVNRGLFFLPRYCILSTALTKTELDKVLKVMTEVLGLISSSERTSRITLEEKSAAGS
jgi:glutamate-1-semialdehyde 2,1-aminomutase